MAFYNSYVRWLFIQPLLESTSDYCLLIVLRQGVMSNYRIRDTIAWAHINRVYVAMPTPPFG